MNSIWRSGLLSQVLSIRFLRVDAIARKGRCRWQPVPSRWPRESVNESTDLLRYTANPKRVIGVEEIKQVIVLILAELRCLRRPESGNHRELIRLGEVLQGKRRDRRDRASSRSRKIFSVMPALSDGSGRVVEITPAAGQAASTLQSSFPWTAS